MPVIAPSVCVANCADANTYFDAQIFLFWLLRWCSLFLFLFNWSLYCDGLCLCCWLCWTHRLIFFWLLAHEWERLLLTDLESKCQIRIFFCLCGWLGLWCFESQDWCITSSRRWLRLGSLITKWRLWSLLTIQKVESLVKLSDRWVIALFFQVCESFDNLLLLKAHVKQGINSWSSKLSVGISTNVHLKLTKN